MYRILDQTAELLVIDKSPGISVHKDQEIAGLTMQLQKDLALEQIYLVHRLDKVTSGVMVFAKSAQAASALAEQFRSRQVKKFYLAISKGKPRRKQGLICGDMDRSRRGMWKLLKTRRNPAITQFFSCSVKPGYRLFLLKPTTGKTHQIRVALKSEGAAILGDKLYSGVVSDRTYLHAYSLGFAYAGEEYRYLSLPSEGEFFDEACIHAITQHFSDPEALNWPNIK